MIFKTLFHTIFSVINVITFKDKDVMYKKWYFINNTLRFQPDVTFLHKRRLHTYKINRDFE